MGQETYSYDTFLSPFTWRYGSQEMRRLWSEEHKRRLWRRIWVALAEAEHEAGLVRGPELEHILWPWRWDKMVRVHDLPVSEYVTEETRTERITHREERFRSYFQKARTLRVPFREIVVFGIEMMAGGRLLAF